MKRRSPSAAKVRSRIGYFARIAPEKGLHVLAEAYRIVREQEPNCTLEAAGYMAHEHRAYLRWNRAADEGVGASVSLSRRGGSRAEDRVSRIAWTCSRRPPFTPIRKDFSFWRRWLRAFRSCSRGTARFRKCSHRTGGGILCEPEDPERSLTGLIDDDSRSGIARGAWRRRLMRGVREHYTVAQMASRPWRYFERQRVAAVTV